MSLILDHVNYIYGGDTALAVHALKDVNLVIPDGQFIGLIGHTGSGKSTLVQHLNGLIKPTSGSIYYNGEDIHAEDYDKKKLRSKVGLVFQYPEHQLFEATVIKDVEFGPRNMGQEPLQVELNSFQALKDVGISEELLDVSVLALSGGQKRRVAIAGVLAMQPEFLVLDEPMAGLDPAGRREIFSLLKKLHEERGITIVFVSHSMEDVAEYADRVVVMNQGQIVLDGKPRRIFHYEKELQQIGLGVPQAAQLVHRLAERGAGLEQDCLTADEGAAAILKWLGK